MRIFNRLHSQKLYMMEKKIKEKKKKKLKAKAVHKHAFNGQLQIKK